MRDECQNGQWELQGLSLSNASNVRQLPMKTLLVQLELLGIIKPLYAYFAEFKYKFLQEKAPTLATFEGERRSFLEAIFNHSQFKKIWGEPNFESLYQAHQYPRERIVAALEYLADKNFIELQSKRITEVFDINLEALNQPDLAQQLHDYFIEKEQKEITRIASLVRFFELDSCLNHMLSLYFDDQQSPAKCGHCSVCRGQVAKLEYSQQAHWPDDSTLLTNLLGLKNHMAQKTDQVLSLDSHCRFLSGISVPMFSRYKVRQLSGFASCENIRYSEIRLKVESLWHAIGQ